MLLLCFKNSATPPQWCRDTFRVRVAAGSDQALCDARHWSCISICLSSSDQCLGKQQKSIALRSLLGHFWCSFIYKYTQNGGKLFKLLLVKIVRGKFCKVERNNVGASRKKFTAFLLSPQEGDFGMISLQWHRHSSPILPAPEEWAAEGHVLNTQSDVAVGMLSPVPPHQLWCYRCDSGWPTPTL